MVPPVLTRLLRSVRDVGLLAIRCTLGVILVSHGLRRWQVLGIDAEVERMAADGVPASFVWASVAFEVIGGGLLVFGLGTIAIGLLTIVHQVLIVMYVKSDKGFWLANGGYEYNFAIAALGLVCMLWGAGRLGVDRLFLRPTEDESEPIPGLFDPEAPDQTSPPASAP